MFLQPSNVDALRTAWRAVNDDAAAPAEGGWRISNADTPVPRVYVFGLIGGWRLNSADFVKAVHAIQAPAISMHVNSPGGFVWDAVAMYEAIKSHPARVTAHVDGLAASAASFLVQGADHRQMATGSRMVIHDAQGVGIGSPADMQEAMDMLNAISNDIASIYAERAGGTRAAWRKAMSATTKYSAQQSVDAGLADTVSGKPAQGPDGPPRGGDPAMGPDNRTRIIQARHRALTTPGG